MVTQCVYCGAELSESPVASDQGGDSFSPCPQCGKLSGGPETATASEKFRERTGLPPADEVGTGMLFKEPYRLAVAIAGSLMLLFSAFCPLLQIPHKTTHSLNLFIMQPGAATLLTGLVFLSIGFAVYRFYGFMKLSVTLSLITIGIAIANITKHGSDFYPGWGAVVAVIAMAMMLLSSRYRLPYRH
jgi:hypothetical protein